MESIDQRGSAQTKPSVEQFGRPLSPIGSSCSGRTVQHKKVDSFSDTSFVSTVSFAGLPSRVPSEVRTRRPSSSFNLTSNAVDVSPTRHSVSVNDLHRPSFASMISSRFNSAFDGERRDSVLVNVQEIECNSPGGSISPLQLDGSEERESQFDTISLSLPAEDDRSVEEAESPPEDKPFRRWMSTLRRKKHQEPSATTPRQVRWTLDDFEKRAPSPLKPRPVRHQKSSSWGSSIGFVTAVKSATATLASTSMATLSRHGSAWKRRQQQSSVLSATERRPSIDAQISAMDEAANLRSRKRREKLEELIRTEESYVADLKALSNVSTKMLVISCLRSQLTFAGLFHAAWTSDSEYNVRSFDGAEDDRRNLTVA